MSALGIGLIFAGCSTGPPDPPTRELVAWSEKVCTTVKSLDGLQTEIDSLNRYAAAPNRASMLGSYALSYVGKVTSGVENAKEQLSGIAPSRVEEADAYVAGVVSALDGVQRQLPQGNDATITTVPDDQKLAKARTIAGAVATLEPQRPKLTSMVETIPKLTASYNLAPSCEPVKQSGRLAEPAPSRALVSWSNTMCANTVDRLPKSPFESPALSDPRVTEAGWAELTSYLQSAPSQVDSLADQLARLTPTGIAEADRYRGSLLAAVQDVRSKLPRNDFRALRLLPIDQLQTRAKHMADLIASIKPQEPDLATIASHDPKLAVSYNLAPNCGPPDPSGSQ